MSLFQNTSGRSGEDIATEIIAHLLSSWEEYIPFQRLFYYRIFKKPLSSAQIKAQITTQPSFEKGRPDLVILSAEDLIVIETKLGSYLSGDDQLIRYCDVFEEKKILEKWFSFVDISSIKNHYLGLLAPSKTIELSIKKSSILCRQNHSKEFEDWCVDKNVQFIPLPWEEIVLDIDMNDTLQKELSLFISTFLNQELMEEEMEILENNLVPKAITKMINVVYDIREYLLSEGFKAGRIGQSYQYYGFTITLSGIELWFGYSLTTWADLKAPVILQAKKEWIHKSKSELLQNLNDLGFTKNEDLELALPFHIEKIDRWKNDIIELLNSLNH